MYQLPTLIEDIRTALTNPGLVAPDKLEEYAQQYAEECAKLNERLRQCVPTLRSGNISEAVRLAEMPPNVIETFNLLDFLGRDEWLGTCDEYGFEPPPPLADNLFQELNDAYLQTSSLEPLLEWQRFHALNGSPLRYRLAVLRSLAKADPMNIDLQNDQETFERARIDELKRDIAEALAKKDAVRLQELYRELTDPGWRITPPKEFLQRICATVLDKQVDELIQHFSAFDYPNAAAVYQSMLNVLRAGQMRMPTAIEKSISAAVQWLQETEGEAQYFSEFQQATEELRESLEGYTSRGELEDLYYVLQNAATRANHVIPQELETYYRSRIDHLTRVERNRYMIVMAIFIGVILLVGTLFVYAMWRDGAEARAERRTEEAQRTEAANREKERAEEFNRFCSEAADRMEQNPDMERLRAVERLFKQADGLKRTPQETNRLTELRSEHSRLRSAAQVAVDREFSEQLLKYRRELNDLPSRENENYSLGELITRLQELDENANILLSESPDISQKQKQAGGDLLRSINTRRQSLRGVESTALQGAQDIGR